MGAGSLNIPNSPQEKTGNSRARKLLTGGLLLDYLCMMEDKRDSMINREKLVRIVQELLKTDQDLGFLKELKKEDLERLVACIRDRIDHHEVARLWREGGPLPISWGKVP